MQQFWKLPWGWVRHTQAQVRNFDFEQALEHLPEGQGACSRPARILVKLSERCISQEFQWNKRPLP